MIHPPQVHNPTAPRWPRLVLLFLLVWALLMTQFSQPWFGVHDSTRVWVAASIRNYDLYGLERNTLLFTRDVGPTPPEEIGYYTNHPPGIVWLPALLTRAFGTHEGGVRFGFMAATLLSMAALYVLVRRLFHDERLAFWTVALYGPVPMIGYFGAMPGMFHLALAIGLTFAAVLVNWLRRPTGARLALLMALAALMAWASWAGVISVAIFGLAAFLLGDGRHRRGVVLIGLAGAVSLAAMFAVYAAQAGDAFDNLFDVFLWRASSASDDPGTRPFSTGEFVVTTLVHMLVYVTPGVLVLAVIGVVPLWQRASRMARGMTLALLGGGVAYQVIFRNASYVHDYYKIPLVPALALFAAAALIYSLEGRRRQTARRLRPVLGGLVLASMVVGIAVYGLMLAAIDRPWLAATIDAVNAASAPGDVIATHLEGKVNLMPLEYYTFREAEGGLTYTEAVTWAASLGGDRRLFYVACEDAAAGPLPVGESQPAGDCTLLVTFPDSATAAIMLPP